MARVALEGDGSGVELDCEDTSQTVTCAQWARRADFNVCRWHGPVIMGPAEDRIRLGTTLHEGEGAVDHGAPHPGETSIELRGVIFDAISRPLYSDWVTVPLYEEEATTLTTASA